MRLEVRPVHVCPLLAVALSFAVVAPALAQTAPAQAPAQTAPAQAPAPAYGYVFTPPAPATGSPQILKVELNSAVLRAGGPIAIRVTTTPDVARVVTGSGKRQGTLTLAAPGVFTSQSTLPHVGGLLSVHVKLHFAATTADGKTTAVDVPVSYK
jgi:hypothetical protein